VPLPPDVIGLATVVLPEGIAGRQTTDDHIVWAHIRLTNTGQTGWFSDGLLKYTATPVP
jgi:hypothetical protein